MNKEEEKFDSASAEPAPTLADAGLSECELKVLRCLVQDMTNRGIADALHITPNTVNYHLKSVYCKLGVKGRVGAAVWAVKHLPPFLED